MASVVEQVQVSNDISLFRQQNSPYWQARFKVAGKWYTRTTKRTEQTQAAFRAAELRSEVQTKISQGIPLRTDIFETLAQEVIEQLEAEYAETSRRCFKDYIQAIRNYLIPFFGKTKLAEIDKGAVESFNDWRKNKWDENYNKLPSKSVLLNHNAALNRIFDLAVDKGQMSPMKRPKLTAKHGLATGTRKSFSVEEVNQVLDECKRWIPLGKKQISKDTRQLLELYVHFILATGIRVGTEIDNLRWKDIKKTEFIGSRGEKKECFEITIAVGKTADRKGKRIIRMLAENVEYIFVELKRFNNATSSEDYIFALPDGKRSKELNRNFKQVLTKLGIANKSEFTLYSLRHTYITRRLEEGISPALISRHCGTSIDMLEKHYNHAFYMDESAGHGSNYHGGSLVSNVKLDELEEYIGAGEILIKKAERNAFFDELLEDGMILKK